VTVQIGGALLKDGAGGQHDGQGDVEMRALTVEELGFVAGGFGEPNSDGGGGFSGLGTGQFNIGGNFTIFSGLENVVPPGFPRPTPRQRCPFFISSDRVCPPGFAALEISIPAETSTLAGELEIGTGTVTGAFVDVKGSVTVNQTRVIRRGLTYTQCRIRPTPAAPCVFEGIGF
jgi:hypothetical protein